MGATVLTNLQGILQIPKQTAGSTAYWVTENIDDITESDLAFGQIELRPRAVACLTTFSKRLLMQSNPSIEKMVREDFVLRLALAADYGAILGPGVAGAPMGIANTPGINTTALGVNGGFWNFEAAKDQEGTLEDLNALRGELGYLMHPKVKRKLQKERIKQYVGDTEGAYVMLPMSNDQLAERLDYKFKTTTQIPTNLTKGGGSNLSMVFFGNWRDLLIGQWGGIELDASIHAGDAFKKNQVKIRAVMEMDTALRHPESFNLISDAETV